MCEEGVIVIYFYFIRLIKVMNLDQDGEVMPHDTSYVCIYVRAKIIVCFDFSRLAIKKKEKK